MICGSSSGTSEFGHGNSTALCLLVRTLRHICANRFYHSIGWCGTCTLGPRLRYWHPLHEAIRPKLEFILLSVHGDLFSYLLHTEMLYLYASATRKKPKWESYLPRIGSILYRLFDTIRLMSVRLWRMAHGRVVSTLGTSVGGGVALRLWGPGSATGIQRMKQFAHKKNLLCCQCMEASSHVSSISKIKPECSVFEWNLFNQLKLARHDVRNKYVCARQWQNTIWQGTN